MQSLAPHTHQIFNQVTSLECIKDYVLVGGTALSLQLGTRLSEDLDFMRWANKNEKKPEVNWVEIEKELKQIGRIQAFEIFDFSHVQFVVEGVKFSFYVSDKLSPVTNAIHHSNNLFLADLLSIAAMKMEVMLRRSNFRDYYDIYSLLKHGVSFKSAVELSLKYSNHMLTTKNLLAILTDSSRFRVDSSFEQLNPVYKVTAEEIENHIKSCIQEDFGIK
jgi:predicted nucleotidyltransferase component of viral defense system